MWIGVAMVVGLLLGRGVPGLGDVLQAVQVDGISLPIAVGLLVMVFALAWLFLPDLPEYRTGLIIVGLARCIAMVIIWNGLACGDREAAAVLVAINSVFQVFAFAVLGWFYLTVLPGWLGLDQTRIDASTWYEEKFLPRSGPFALYGLLFTIVVLFALQGEAITANPLDVVRVALPPLPPPPRPRSPPRRRSWTPRGREDRPDRGFGSGSTSHAVDGKTCASGVRWRSARGRASRGQVVPPGARAAAWAPTAAAVSRRRPPRR